MASIWVARSGVDHVKAIVDLDADVADIKATIREATELSGLPLARMQLRNAMGMALSPMKSLRAQGIMANDMVSICVLPDNLFTSDERSATDPTYSNMHHFWSALLDAQLSDANALTLPEGATWLGECEMVHSIFVRAAYLEIWRQIEEQLDRQLQRPSFTFPSSSFNPHDVLPFSKITIQGTPGVGKSCFGLYLLWCARRRGMDVVLLRAERPCFILQADGRVHCFSHPLHLTVVDAIQNNVNPNMLLIVDGKSPPLGTNVLTVLITSPRKQAYWDFNKQTGATLRYMPPLDASEIEACRAVCFPHLPAQQVSDSVGRWGGVPRYVLQHANDASEQGLLRQAILTANVEHVIRSEGNLDIADDACHRLVHLCRDDAPDPPSRPQYSSYRAGFASDYVRSQLLELFYNEQRSKLITFLESASDLGKLGGFRGLMWEHYAHRRLRAGGKFRVRRLSKDAISSEDVWTLPPREQRDFSNWGQVVSVLQNQYVQPTQQNLAAIDSFVISPTMLFQITVGRTHEIKRDGIITAVNSVLQIAESRVVNIVFVLPPDVYATFSEQPFSKRGGDVHRIAVSTDSPVSSSTAVLGKRAANNFHEIVQFALEMDLK